jgi:hypothetical protein
MYKTVCVVAILLSALVLTSGGSDNGSSLPLTSPRIVARGKLLNQTTFVPLTTLFSVPASGLYRLSVYGATTTTDPSSQSSYNYFLYWTDLSGSSNADLDVIAGDDNTLGVWNQVCCSYPTGTQVFQAEEGTAVTYQVTQSGPPDAAVYALYWTVERLE